MNQHFTGSQETSWRWRKRWHAGPKAKAVGTQAEPTRMEKQEAGGLGRRGTRLVPWLLAQDKVHAEALRGDVRGFWKLVPMGPAPRGRQHL